MGWGDGMGSLGGTADPLPLPISCTNNMPHASWARPILYDWGSPALKPSRTTRHALLPAVSNSHTTGPLNPEQILYPLGDFSCIRAVTFIKQWHKYVLWGNNKKEMRRIDARHWGTKMIRVNRQYHFKVHFNIWPRTRDKFRYMKCNEYSSMLG